jgi:predicted secreted protein
MPAVVLTRQDHGRTIKASVGAALSLQLDESPTTGYTWVDRSAGDLLKLERSDFSLDGAAVGGGGRRSFLFSIGAPGTASLRLVLVHAWEADALAVDEFVVVIDAAPP